MRSHWNRAIAAAACVCLGGGASIQPAPTGDPSEVLKKFEVLAAGAVIEESVELEAGDYFEIEIEQVEGDIAVELVDPGGRVAAVSDLPGKPWIAELLAVVTESEGAHRLRITASGPRQARLRETGRESRPARAGDRALTAAMARRAEALRSKDLETVEGIRAAVSLFEQALDALSGAEAPEWRGRVLLELGHCRQRAGEMEAAGQNLRESVEVLRGIGATRRLADSLNYYGGFQLERGDRAAARSAFEEALSLAREAGDEGIEALAWNNLGGFYYYEGDMEKVVEAWERSLAVGARSGLLGARANTLANLGEAYRALGRYSDALELSQEAFALARRLGDTGQEMRVHNNRGVLLKGVGDLRGAISDYEAGLALALRLGDLRWQANIESNLGAIYRMMGHRRRALEYLERALEAAVRAGSATDEIWASISIGELLREWGDDGADSFLESAQERSREAGNKRGEAYSLYGLGRSRQDAGQVAEAAALLGQALVLLEEVSDRPGQMSAHRELARAMAGLGDFEQATEHFLASLALARLVGDPYQEAATRARYAQLLLDTGDLEAARSEVSLALATVESIRQGVVEPHLRAGLLSRSQRDFTLLVDILETLDSRFPRQGHASQAFAVAERSRARSLVEILTESEADLIGDLPEELRRRRRDLAGRLSEAQKSLTRSLGREEIVLEETEAIRARVRELNLEREALEREIRLSDPRWDRLVYPEPLGLAAAQALLEPGQAMVSFVLGERGSFVFAITRHEAAFERIAPESVLNPMIEQARAYLEQPGRRSIGRFRSLAAKLYAELLAPVEHVLGDQSHLLISPDGLLHYLPFEALVPPERLADPGEYLLSRWAVSYLPSASTLAVLRQRAPKPAPPAFDLAAFADPTLPGQPTETGGSTPALRGLEDQDSWDWRSLAGARSEVEAIAALFTPDRSRVFLGTAASESSFRDAAGEARYLHVASHALIDSAEPALSALLLTAGAGDDGLLQTHEIFELDLRADLVVLSGCETALGRAVRGEGLLGMTRAFLYAGASAVAVSLWPVEDESTSQLMVGFYNEVSRGQTDVQALRRAKLDRIAAPASSHPYYWAPFVLVGSSSARSVE